jgi:hypothetical protein
LLTYFLLTFIRLWPAPAVNCASLTYNKHKYIAEVGSTYNKHKYIAEVGSTYNKHKYIAEVGSTYNKHKYIADHDPADLEPASSATRARLPPAFAAIAALRPLMICR